MTAKYHVTETFERYENGKLVERTKRVHDGDGELPEELQSKVPTFNRFFKEFDDWLGKMPKFGRRL